jgi:hypothetical protein
MTKKGGNDLLRINSSTRNECLYLLPLANDSPGLAATFENLPPLFEKTFLKGLGRTAPCC